MRYRFCQWRLPMRYLAACIVGVLQPITASRIKAQAAPSIDSAGVRIFTFTADGMRKSTLRLTGVPTVRLRPLPDCGFYRVSAILLLKGGKSVVANSGNSELCFFDRNGEFLRKSGREGSGPGEFQDLTFLQRMPGDSLLVYDAMLRRFSLFKSDGSFVKTIALTPPPGVGGSVTLVVALLDGTLLVGYSEVTTARPSPVAVGFSQVVFRYDVTGELVGRVGRFLEREHFIQEVPPQFGGIAYWMLAFGRSTTVVATPGGFVVGDGSAARVSFYSYSGRLSGEYRSDEVARPVSPSDIKMYRRSELAKARAEQRAIEQRRVMEMPYPRLYPAYRRFLIDPMKRVWLERYPPPDTSAGEWTVWDPASIRPLRVTMPVRFRPLAVSQSSICGVTRSQDNEEAIVCYGVEH